jgi:hypothetical protein
MRNGVPDVATPEKWAFFARNWGNEGMCSHTQWQIAFHGNQYVFQLPWQPASDADVLVHLRSDHQGSSAWINKVPGTGIFVTVQLAAPEQRAIVWGELTVHWKVKLETSSRSVQIETPIKPGLVQRVIPTASTPLSSADPAEERMERLVAGLSKRQRLRLSTALKRSAPARTAYDVPIVEHPLSAAPVTRPLLDGQPDAAATARLKALAAALSAP